MYITISSCALQVDLIKDNGDIYFIRFLDSSEPSADAVSRAQATFVLSVICDGHPKVYGAGGQGLGGWQSGVLHGSGSMISCWQRRERKTDRGGRGSLFGTCRGR